MSNPYKLVLVEDDEIDIISVKRSLDKLGNPFPLYVAHDGIEALDILKTGIGPVLVILDINMPRMNGLEFLKVLRADQKLYRTPVIVLTSSKADSDINSAYDYNIAGYLIKPVTEKSLNEMLESLCAYWAMSQTPVR